MKKLSILILFLGLFLTGCSGKDSQMKEAILKANYETFDNCLPLPTSTAPNMYILFLFYGDKYLSPTSGKSAFYLFYGKDGGVNFPKTAVLNDEIMLMDYFTKIGFMTKETNNQKKGITLYVYKPTSASDKYRKHRFSALDGSHSYMCAGDLDVEITKVNEVQASGISVAEVEYTEKVVNLADWTKDPILDKVYQNFPRLSNGWSAKINLYKTDKGYEAEPKLQF